jgi:hypothetical protein
VNVGTLTVRVSAAVFVVFPDTPVMVSGYVPAGTELVVVNVSVVFVEVGLGVQRGVTPAGSPAMLNVTLLLKPYWPYTET